MRRVLCQFMSSREVRANLRRACKEIEDTCEDLSLSDEEYLRKIVEQLRYLNGVDRQDPEALAFPDPDSLDTIVENLGDVISDVEGDAAVRLERAREELLLAISMLKDRLERQHETKPD